MPIQRGWDGRGGGSRGWGGEMNRGRDRSPGTPAPRYGKGTMTLSQIMKGEMAEGEPPSRYRGKTKAKTAKMERKEGEKPGE